MEHLPNTTDHHLMTVLLAGFRRSNDVMFYSNAKGVILDINEAFTAHYGYTRAEAVGKTPALLRSRHSYSLHRSPCEAPQRGRERAAHAPRVLRVRALRGRGLYRGDCGYFGD